MSDERSNASRRWFLKGAGVAAAMVGTGGVVLSRSPYLRDRIVEASKGVAERVRAIPGLGYGRRATPLSYVLGGRNVLTAAKRQPGHWRGAPALAYDPATDRLFTHVRHRDPKHRGHRVSIYALDRETLEPTELLSIEKDAFDARSVEGGELLVEDGEFRWFVSYQHARTGDWEIQERRGPTVDSLASGGTRLGIVSEFRHSKDPALVNGEFYVISNSSNWLGSSVQRVDIDADRPAAETVPVDSDWNARVTTGGVVGSEVFADVWPDFPGTDASNVLWTTDERSATGRVDDSVWLDESVHYGSACGSSVTYVDAALVGDRVYLLWQEEKPGGNNDLVGTRLPVEEYERLFVETAATDHGE